ncbi:hypothetical protein HanXRQr2_Chr07g0287811 [Helianthus annuus]|uniref:Uncharacterized protein n=1 Tax=Helianthus annuus TaxID=4232 RepID=A0A251UD12_HELAN|nr:hypothetical protein HanXRQr2_Chr07g0287811 [Helianthus annuus]KAJ0904150.1 hypothetical protein HanPSC8_Chr07g0278621 [Helianthus annuus]
MEQLHLQTTIKTLIFILWQCCNLINNQTSLSYQASWCQAYALRTVRYLNYVGALRSLRRTVSHYPLRSIRRAASSSSLLLLPLSSRIATMILLLPPQWTLIYIKE